MLDESIRHTLAATRAGLAADPAGLAALRRQAAQGERGAALEAAAQEFEALLIGQMLQTMRAAQQTSSPFDSQATETYQALLDQESARQFAAQGGLGLRDMIVQQLSDAAGHARRGRPATTSEGPIAAPTERGEGGARTPPWAGLPLDPAQYPGHRMRSAPVRVAGDGAGRGDAASDIAATRLAASASTWAEARALRLPERRADLRPIGAAPAQGGVGDGPGESAAARTSVDDRTAATRRGTVSWPPASPADFVQRLRPYAERAAAALGIDAATVLAQSALETGWGQRLPGERGRTSFNLFGIKAHGGWNGPQVTNATYEVRDGVARRETARFRVYASPEQSFRDYVRFLRENPRYREALRAGVGDGERFIRGIHRAGYATDPAYADKVLAVRERVQALMLADATHPSAAGRRGAQP